MAIDTVINALNEMKKIAPNGEEYWTARDISSVLGYSEWRNLVSVIEKAKMACDSSGSYSSDHFVGFTDMIEGGKGAMVDRENYYLSRYACYLIAMNGDPGKPEIGTAQTYFAVQTRRQEKIDQLTEEDRRLELRERVRVGYTSLMGAAKSAGVQNYGTFTDAGYRGLYGMGLSDIKRKKRIPPKEHLLDCSGRTELAANEFRQTQTEQKLNRDKIQGEVTATNIHRKIGAQVRETIKSIGGTMPEDLPAEISTKKLKAMKKQMQKKPTLLLP